MLLHGYWYKQLACGDSVFSLDSFDILNTKIVKQTNLPDIQRKANKTMCGVYVYIYVLKKKLLLFSGGKYNAMFEPICSLKKCLLPNSSKTC